MICPNCGNAIDDNAAVCVHCGVPTVYGSAIGLSNPNAAPVNPEEPASKGMLILSFLIPLAGIIIGATDSSKGKKRAGKACMISAVCGMVFWIVFSIILAFILTIGIPMLLILLTSSVNTNY